MDLDRENYRVIIDVIYGRKVLAQHFLQGKLRFSGVPFDLNECNRL